MAWTICPDGVVDFVNQRSLDYAGLSLEEEIEEPTGGVHPEDLPRVMEKWLPELAAGESHEDALAASGRGISLVFGSNRATTRRARRHR